MKDWQGTSTSIFAAHGASNHSEGQRETHDFYATPPIAVEKLLELEDFATTILEPCCGAGHISKVLEEHGHEAVSHDLYDHGYGVSGIDFLTDTGFEAKEFDIITNPPYKFAREFVEKSLSVLSDGHKCAMFLKLTFLEGKGRKALFDTRQLKTVYVSRSRLNCGMNGEFTGTSAVAYAWFVWVKGFSGDPTIKWFN